MTKKVGLSILASASLIFLVNCGTKFEEGSPDSVDGGLPASTRMASKELVDLRISKVNNSINKIQQFIELARKAVNSNQLGGTYTPFDLLIDINRESKKKLPQLENGKMIRYVSFNLNNNTIPQQCQRLQSKIQYTLIDEFQNPVETKEEASGDQLTYMIAECNNPSSYLKVFTTSWVGSDVSFDVDNYALYNLFSSYLLADTFFRAHCKITNDSSGILNNLECNNLGFKLSSIESVNIVNLLFSNSGSIKFSSIMDISENSSVKNRIELTVNSSGDTNIKELSINSGNSLLNAPNNWWGDNPMDAGP